MSKAPKPKRLWCQACRLIVQAGHEQEETHRRNEEEWRSWMGLEQAVAIVDPAPCPPNWTPE